ncbi:MAG TPA: glycosyltransferase family 9 protein [Anaeromyxobacteraceae bacterium]|jgi:ADP-heptose:LPS heptosyltransferase
MPRLSIIVITRNEERNLPGLLASVRGVGDEVVVVDSGSTDHTVEMARALGARVLHKDWIDYGTQRLFAVAQATHDWVLSLDADERLSPELAQAIRAEMARPEAELPAAYRVHFRHRVFGRPARFGAMWRDRRIRLFDRRRGNYDGAPIHERILVDGPVALLPGRCDHEGFREPAEAAEKLRRYALAAARERYRHGARFRPWHWLRWPAGFLKRWVFRLGFLDGRLGLRLALLYAGYDLGKVTALRALDVEIGGRGGRGRLRGALRAVGRSLALALATAVFRPPRRGGPVGPLRKILVVRPDERLGDLLLTTPLLRALRRGLPGCELHVLVADRLAHVAEGPLVDRVIAYEKRLFFRRPWQLAGLLRDLRRQRYDAAIDAGHWFAFSLTASLLTRAAGARVQVGHDRGQAALFLSHPVAHDPACEREVAAKLELLAPLGVAPAGPALESALGRDGALAAAVLARTAARAPFAVLNPGARMADRRWPAAAHAAVARGLRVRGLDVLVVWGPGEEEMGRAVALAAEARLAPPTGIVALASLLRRAALCVSNDSGPMHLAVALGTPTVGIFIAGDEARWGHALPHFAAAQPRGEKDSAAVLAACDRLLAVAPAGAASRSG